MPKLRKLTTESEDLERVQDNISNAYDEAIQNPILQGIILSDILLVSGSDNTVNHKLQRKPIGYKIILRDANATIWNGELNDRFLILNTDANVTISLYIF